MRFESSDILCLLICLSMFIVMQAFFINGVYELFKGSCVNVLDRGLVCDGNLGYKLGQPFFEKHKAKTWAKPFFACIKCMASFWGLLTFWPLVIYIFGFRWEEIPVCVFDLCALISVNWLIYKKL